MAMDQYAASVQVLIQYRRCREQMRWTGIAGIKGYALAMWVFIASRSASEAKPAVISVLASGLLYLNHPT
jgi:hypothetical protein